MWRAKRRQIRAELGAERWPTHGQDDMHNPDLGTIKAARRAIELVLQTSTLHRNPVPFFESTDLGSLPEPEQQKEHAARQANDQANRIRGASHLCLSAAFDTLSAFVALSQITQESVPDRRTPALQTIAKVLQGVSDEAMHAAGVLVGRQPPPSDDSLVIQKKRDSSA